ncbi:MAG: protein kinase [Kofleriaceae bacterium]
MAIDETLPAENLPVVTTSSGDGPPTSWDRYELGDKLGEGGMGVVYRAQDRRLGRGVAIKFIRGGNPVLTMRLLREARAQARIDHPGVCRVYEVGEVAGRAYIALQLVDGEPLSKAQSTMTLDEKIAVMRDVCVAIHEAHRLGIVHRDLKPANIMVERGEDGRWQPIVMDFGLAREATIEVGLTETGALLGTPAYMSPEQARGDVRSIDRRSDVYSLGATLYELLVGKPLFATESLADALHHVIHEDPAPPRKFAPTTPLDLETITMKCLRKSPDERYPSARALADDLTRYLDGEPIEGRRPTLRQRLRASVKKHKALYVIGAVSTAAVLTAGGFGVRSYLVSRDERARSSARTQLAERLGRDAKDIELLLRTTYQLPLHDTRPERDRVRAKMAAIESTKHDLGPLGDAVVHDALGRGHLALHEWAQAVTELDHAAKDGLDTPELHAARGRALGELYHQAIEEARRNSSGKEWLTKREAELEAQYLTPALAELERARGSTDDSALLEVFIALYRRDFAAAKSRALDVAKATPWLYEAKKLAADAVSAAAFADVDRGNYDAARTQLDEANALYAQAIDAARSDASTYEAAATAREQRYELDYRQNHVDRLVLEDATSLIDHALEADPTSGNAYTAKAHIALGRYRANVDKERLPLLNAASVAAQRASEIDTSDASAWDALGDAHTYRGIYEAYHGGSGVNWWNQALGELDKALAIRPNDPWFNNDAGIAHRWLGSALQDAGKDPSTEYRSAIDRYQRATKADPSYVYAWSNQVDLGTLLADYQREHEIDPGAVAQTALEAGKRGLELDGNFALLVQNMAELDLIVSNYALEHGQDPSPMIASARSKLDRADTIKPNDITTWWERARAARFEALWLMSQHRDPKVALAAARESSSRAIAAMPSSVAAWVERAEDELLAKDLEAARADANKSVSLDDQDPLAHIVAGEVAIAQIANGNLPARAEAIKHLDRALEIDPQSKRAKAARDSLR